MQKRTKIVCTLGPATEQKDIIGSLIDAGMNMARLNFSHGSYEQHEMLIKQVRALGQEKDLPIAIMQDLQGPKIRVGSLPEEGIMLAKDETVTFDTSQKQYHDGHIPVDYAELHLHVKAGERMLLNDGRAEVHITAIQGTIISGMVIVGGLITSHKGINVPDSKLDVRALTDKDKEDLQFGVEHDVDYVAVSFVQTPDDILDVRYLIKEYEKEMNLIPEHPIRIIAKIERPAAVERIDEILDVADGIMIARGDLGIEIAAAEVPLVQKKLIDKALCAAKPVIVATQMLDSMQENPRPTRAEVSDVANAVIDHTDAVMLSNETATGQYPIETVQTMAQIICETEASVYDDMPIRSFDHNMSTEDVITGMSRILAEDVGAKAIVAASLSGSTGRLISRYRPELPIAVTTSSERVQRQLNLSWGVLPFLLNPCRSVEELVERSVVVLKEDELIAKDDKIIVVAGEPVGQEGHVNLLEVRTV